MYNGVDSEWYRVQCGLKIALDSRTPLPIPPVVSSKSSKSGVGVHVYDICNPLLLCIIDLDNSVFPYSYYSF